MSSPAYVLIGILAFFVWGINFWGNYTGNANCNRNVTAALYNMVNRIQEVVSMKDRTQRMDEQAYGILVIRRNLDDQVSGSLYHHLHEEKLRFNGYMGLMEVLHMLSGSLALPAAGLAKDRLSESSLSSRLEERVNRIEGGAGARRPRHTYQLQLRHYFNSTWQGVLRSRETGEIWQFESFLELIRILELQLGIQSEQTWFPQQPQGTYMYRRNGQRFAVSILFQRNKTWQGQMRWIEGRRTVNFRSCLELMLILKEISSDKLSEGRIFDRIPIAKKVSAI